MLSRAVIILLGYLYPAYKCFKSLEDVRGKCGSYIPLMRQNGVC